MQCGTNQRKQRNETIPQRKRESREVPRAVSCASASLQRGTDFPVASQDRSVKDAEDGRGSEDSAVLHIVWRKKAMVPRRAITFRCIVRLVKRREGFGVQSLAVHSNLQISGCSRAFVLDGTKRFHDVTLQVCVRSRSRHQDQNPQAATHPKQNKIADRTATGNGDQANNDLVQMVLAETQLGTWTLFYFGWDRGPSRRYNPKVFFCGMGAG